MVVITAFLAMAAVSYFSARGVMERHLAENAENALVTAEANVAEGLARTELMLLNAYHAVRDMLEKGEDANISAYLQRTADWMRGPVNGVPGFYGIYAYIQDEFINGIGFTPPAAYRPEERPWYQAAKGLGDGQVGYTAPYQDVSSGDMIISAVQNLYDLDGVYCGILVMDVEISWFEQYVQSLYHAPGAYGMLLNQDMMVISHPGTEWIGRPLGEMGGGYAEIAAELPQNAIQARRITDTTGEPVIVFFKRMSTTDTFARMDKGWYEAQIIPIKSYYRDINTIVLNPSFLGLILILVFSLIMLRIIAARIRTEEINQDHAISKAQLEKIVKVRTAELEVQTRLAKSAAEAKGNFLANMSHEIRTPLNAVIGMTEIARRSTTIEKKDASLKEIAAASDHLLDILNDVLDMSKIESGKFTLVHEPFALSAAMEEVAVIISRRCEEKHITFEPDFVLPSNSQRLSGIVMGDKLRLKQVLINLLGNAVKFTPENGTIRFLAETRMTGEKQVEVHFLVSDNGIGMKQEQVDKLFRPFEQTDASIADRFGGTGLGLSISQNMVCLMGGVITVESESGKGSAFEFTLNMDSAEHREEVPAAGDANVSSQNARLPQGFAGKRILLTEDIEINRIIVRELLADTGIEFDDASDGIQALERFSASPEGYYQLIFMDVQMPNMGGYEATRRIRALNRADAKTVPIIAMTANAYREDIDRALEAGMNAHLSKPVSMKEVGDILNQWLT
ncbi:hypothetical protein AGMMS4952_06300 [Spirochaetia bacterium]|nr:hypothetical protein AGMMS4952_06300 [Spirochaetia bacterium]